MPEAWDLMTETHWATMLAYDQIRQIEDAKRDEILMKASAGASM